MTGLLWHNVLFLRWKAVSLPLLRPEIPNQLQQAGPREEVSGAPRPGPTPACYARKLHARSKRGLQIVGSDKNLNPESDLGSRAKLSNLKISFRSIPVNILVVCQSNLFVIVRCNLKIKISRSLYIFDLDISTIFIKAKSKLLAKLERSLCSCQLQVK